MLNRKWKHLWNVHDGWVNVWTKWYIGSRYNGTWPYTLYPPQVMHISYKIFNIELLPQHCQCSVNLYNSISIIMYTMCLLCGIQNTAYDRTDDRALILQAPAKLLYAHRLGNDLCICLEMISSKTIKISLYIICLYISNSNWHLGWVV